EYVDGCDLRDVMRRRGPLTIAETLDHTIQAARGLEAAHALGIVHGDIKPSNLILDSSGVVRVLGLGLSRIMDAASSSAPGATGSGTSVVTVDFMAPEQADDSRQVDRRADIYSLGCTLHYLLTGRPPIAGDTIAERLLAHKDRPAPSLKAARPDLPISLEDVFQRMMARNPAERPASMTELIALLEECRSAGAEASPSPAAATSPDSPRGAGRDAAAFARRTEADALEVGPELTVEDIATNIRSEAPLAAQAIPAIRRGPGPRSDAAGAVRPVDNAPVHRINLAVQAAVVLLMIGFAGMLVVASRRGASRSPAVSEPASEPLGSPNATGPVRPKSAATPEVPVPRMLTRTIFDGKSPDGWMLTNRRRLDRRHVQPDGLNPHGTGSYLVVYREKLGDFVLDFDYKLSPGGNSGVFLRVGDLSDPVNTGIEVELSDSTGTTDHDPGAFNGLVAPAVNAQKPAGQWNHMTITADGPKIAVRLNDDEVSSINLDQWTVPGKRPDGSPHKFPDMAVADLPRSGYIGFQDLKGDCWFRHIVLKAPARDSSGASIPTRAGAGHVRAPLVLLDRSPGNG
ncbi:MAG: family 16 glycoside hydrolase, partial [Isosphaeraceae bacterium]